MNPRRFFGAIESMVRSVHGDDEIDLMLMDPAERQLMEARRERSLALLRGEVSHA